jgi:glucose/arabinose dehydrogenase
MARFELADLPDPSVSPPEPHEFLLPSDFEFFPDRSGDSLITVSTGLVVWLDRHFSVRGTFQVDSANTLAKYRARGNKFTDNEGLLGVTFDPRFEENGWFYVHTVPETRGGVEIWRLRWKPDQVARLWEGRELILRIDKPPTVSDPIFLTNHDGGNPSFGPDGMLYVALGDGGIGGGLGWASNPAQDLSLSWGKLLRVDPTGLAPPEIVAYGLRNPFTHAWRGRELYIGDVSADSNLSWEEINRFVVEQSSLPPVNFGWPLSTGPCAVAPLAGPCAATTDPVHGSRTVDTQFLDDDPETTFPRAPAGEPNRSALILGPAYPGGQYDGYLDNVIVYADLLQGWVRGVLFDARGRKLADRHLFHREGWVTGFAVAPDARLYVLTSYVRDITILRVDVGPG